MSSTISIINPTSGGQSYTSMKKALEYVKRGRAVIEDGLLRFVDHEPKRKPIMDYGELSFWNGSPKPPILRSVKVSGIWRLGDPMHQPGEVRS